jgi:DNA gyrase/topoisomerase IV subunit A
MEKCQALVAEGKLGWVSNESGEKVKVVCYSREVEKLEDNVVPLLFRRLTYNWIALDDAKKPITFNLPSYCQSWLNTRRQTVKIHLEVRLKRLRRQQETEEAKLIVVQHLDEAITALRAPDPEGYALPKFFERHDKSGKKDPKKFARQTEVVLKSSMSLITRASEKRQKELIQKLKEEIQDVTKRLKDIDGVVLEELGSLKPYFDERRTACTF